MSEVLEQEILEVPEVITKKVNDAMRLINSIDLSMVKRKLIDKEDGEGWDEEFLEFAEQRYKRYLCLQFLYPEKSIVPTKDIDTFWHQHILDTRAYTKDCQIIFGEYLHHYPYFGMRDEQDAKDLIDSFEETKGLYLYHFKEGLSIPYKGADSSACHKGTSVCHKCASKPSGCSDTIECKRCN